MEIRKKTLDELKKLRLDYEKSEKLFDANFIKSGLEIIEMEDKFCGKINLEIMDDEYISAEENNGLIRVSLKSLERHAYEVLNVFEELYTKDTVYLIKNYFALLTLVHESSHVWQDLGLDDDSVVNEFYYQIYKRRTLSVVTSFLSDFYSNERHANIDAHKILLDVYDDSELVTISKTFYLNLILYLYGRFSPTEKMQMMFLIPNKFDSSNICTMKKLEVGFPVSGDIIKKIDNQLIREARGDISFEECKRRIREISGVK